MMKPEQLAKNIRYAIAACTLSAFLIVLAFLLFPCFFKSRLDPEIFKLTYQFLLVTVLGGGISYLFALNLKVREGIAKANENAEIERKQEKKIQRDFYHDFVESFNNVKKIRRYLRARARKENDNKIFINLKVYDELMKELTMAQLKFEFFCKEVEFNPTIFNCKDNELLRDLNLIEDYLNKIIEEYEQGYKRQPNAYSVDEEFIAVELLTKLKEFIDPYHESKEFKLKFKETSENISRCIFNLLFSSAGSS